MDILSAVVRHLFIQKFIRFSEMTAQDHLMKSVSKGCLSSGCCATPAKSATACPLRAAPPVNEPRQGSKSSLLLTATALG